MAPEVLNGKYNEKCDIWSCGVICYILLCGYPPINCKNEKELIKRIQEAQYEFDPIEWDSISDLAKHFVKSLLEKDPEKRMSAIQALEHPWIFARKKTQSVDMGLTLKALNNLKTYRVIKSKYKSFLNILKRQIENYNKRLGFLPFPC